MTGDSYALAIGCRKASNMTAATAKATSHAVSSLQALRLFRVLHSGSGICFFDEVISHPMYSELYISIITIYLEIQMLKTDT